MSALSEALESKAADLPNRDALRIKSQDVSFAYKDYKKHAEALTYGLVSLGCRPGDTVATMMGNDAEMAILVLAAARLGVTVAPLDSSMSSSKQDLEKALQDSECRVLLVENSNGNLVNEILPSLKSVQDVASVPKIEEDRFPNLRHVVSTGYHRVNQGILQFRHLLAYNTFARDPAKRAQKLVNDSTPLMRPISKFGDGKSITNGEISKRAASLGSELKLSDSDKLLLESSDPVDLAVALCVSANSTCPLVLPGSENDIDLEELFSLEGCTKRM